MTGRHCLIVDGTFGDRRRRAVGLVGNLLSDRGTGDFEVTDLTLGSSGGKAEPTNRAHQIASFLLQRDPEDLALVVLAADVVTDGSGNWYVSCGEKSNQQLETEALPFSLVNSLVRQSPSVRVAVIFDAGMKAPAIAAGASPVARNSGPVIRFDPQPGRVIVTTQAQLAENTGGSLIDLTVAAITDAAADRDGDGLVTVDELHAFVTEEARRLDLPVPTKRLKTGPEVPPCWPGVEGGRRLQKCVA